MMSNCYTYAMGSRFGFHSPAIGMVPGAYRAETGDRLMHSVNDMKARIIIDGAIPLADPHQKNKNDFSVPVPPPGHYVVAAFVGRYMGHYLSHFVRIERWDGKVVEFSLRDGACVPGFEWAGDAWPDKMPIEIFRTGHSNSDFSYTFVDFYACPDAGTDLSVQRVIHDIHKCRPGALNNLDTGFIDINLKFFEITNELRSLDINDAVAADFATRAYDAAFTGYAPCWYGGKVEELNRKITQAYQKTPLAAADSQRVHELFAKNLSMRDQRIMKKNMVY